MNVTSCRICRSTQLHQILDLGFSPPSDAFLTVEGLDAPETYYPLRLLFCENCGLVQLNFVVEPEVLFRRNYPYDSSVTRTLSEHFAGLAKQTVGDFSIKEGSLVVDIGSNTGVLLNAFAKNGMSTLGVEPAENIANIARARGIRTVPKFFNSATALELVGETGKARIISATNVFAHVNDLHDFVKGIDVLLDSDGVFVIEFPYLVDLVEKLEYDTIYHEHLSYFSLKPVMTLLGQFGMEIVDVMRVSIHGGSIRIFVQRKSLGGTGTGALDELLSLEKSIGLYSEKRYGEFSEEVARHRRDLLSLIDGIMEGGKNVVGVSAPAKGNTLLNYCGIGREKLPYIVEKSSLKFGLYTPGTHIPVLPEQKLLNDRPDYALILAWNFAEEIMKNLHEYKENGGKFIIPIPQPIVI